MVQCEISAFSIVGAFFALVVFWAALLAVIYRAINYANERFNNPVVALGAGVLVVIVFAIPLLIVVSNPVAVLMTFCQ